MTSCAATLMGPIRRLIYRGRMRELMKQDEKCAAFHLYLTGILGNRQTPYILVNATADGVIVPKEYVKDGEITLNISPKAFRLSSARNATLRGRGRFGATVRAFAIPIASVKCLYTKESGAGITMTPIEE